MSLAGRLPMTDSRELLRVLAATSRTGVLTVRQDLYKAFLVFRQGHVVFVGLDGPGVLRESLGSVLIHLGLLNGEVLEDAIQEQRSFDGDWRLGTFLLAIGALGEHEVRLALIEQMRPAVTRILDWRSGSFEFEPLVLSDHGEIPISVDELLRTGAPPLSPEPEGGLPGQDSEAEARSLSELLGRLPGSNLHGEVVVSILDSAASVLDRGAMFLRSAGTITGLGWFGRDVSMRERLAIRRLEVSCDEPSVLRALSGRDTALRARLGEARFDRRFVRLLGDTTPGEVLLLPLPARGNAPVLLCGDNAPTGRAIVDASRVTAALQPASNLLSRTAWY